jgi:hypothetical protein
MRFECGYFRNLAAVCALLVCLAALFDCDVDRGDADARLAVAADIYVSAEGSDSNEGTITAPFRTIQHAIDLAGPGQSVLARGGTYNEFIEFRRSGNSDAPIRLAGYPGETVTLEGSRLDWRYGISLGDFDYIIIENLKVRDYIRDGLRGFGIVGWGDTDNITLRNIDISLVETPVKFAADGSDEIRSNLAIENVTASNYSGGGIDLGPGAVSNVIIRNARLNGTVGGNDTAVDGIAVERGNHITIEQVTLTGHSGDGIDLKADNVTVRRADVRQYGRDGLKLWGEDATAENSLFASLRSQQQSLVLEGAGPYTIRHNLFRGGPGHSYTAGIGPYDPPAATPATTVSLQGNIFYTTENTGTLVYLSPVVTLESRHNIYYSPDRTNDVIAAFIGGSYQTFSSADINNGVWSQAIGTDQTSRYGDPLFAGPESGDYLLRWRSPAIDQVPAALSPSVDLLGKARPMGSAAEIGPYEFGASEVSTRRLSVSVKGEGQVRSDPTGIACPDDCSENYAAGSQVVLTAIASQGWRFVKWRGLCAGSTDCRITVTTDGAVTAKFKRRKNATN